MCCLNTSEAKGCTSLWLPHYRARLLFNIWTFWLHSLSPSAFLLLLRLLVLQVRQLKRSHMQSHMASGSEERAFFDLDRVKGLRDLGGGWERQENMSSELSHSESNAHFMFTVHEINMIRSTWVRTSVMRQSKERQTRDLHLLGMHDWTCFVCKGFLVS